MSQSLRPFFQFVYKKCASQWPLFLASSVTGAGFGVLLALVGLWINQKEVDHGWVFSLSMILIAFIRAFHQFFSTWIVNRQITSEKNELFSNLSKNWVFIRNALSEAQIQKRISTDFPATIEAIWNGTVFLSSQIFTIIVLVSFLWIFSPQIFFVTLCMTLSFTAISFVIRKAIYRFTSRKQNIEDQQFKNEKNLINGFESLSTSDEILKLENEISNQLKTWERNEKSISIVETASDSLQWAIRYGFVILLLTPVLSSVTDTSPNMLYWIYILMGACTQAYWSIHQLAFSQSHWDQCRILFKNHSTQDRRLKVPELLIAARDLTISYSPTGNRPQIGPLNFSWKSNSRIWINGESGIGKTTLIRSLIGFHPLLFGSLAFPDKHYRVEYISQTPFFYDGESVARNLRVKSLNEIPLELIEDLKLGSFFENDSLRSQSILGQNGIQPSRGQRTRLAILRSLIFKPAVLILDEPTAGLDRDTSIEILKTLRRQMKDAILIVADHNPFVAEFLLPTETLNLSPPQSKANQGPWAQNPIEPQLQHPIALDNS